MKSIVCGAALALLISPLTLSAQTSGDEDDLAEVESLNPNPIARLTGRLAFDTDYGVVFGMGFATDRLLGEDQTLEFNIETQEDGTRVNLRYNNDAIFGDSPAFGVNVLRSETSAGATYDFDSTVTRIEPRLTWEVSSALKASAYAYYSVSDISGVPVTSSALFVGDEGEETTSAIGASLEYRFPIEPGGTIRAAWLRFGAEIGSITPDNDFLRVTASGQAIQAFNDGNVVLRSQFRLGALGSQTGTSSIGDRYMLGQGSIRGFEFGGFGPRDLAVAGTPALGGNYYGIAKFDVQFPNAFGEQAARLTPGLFLDLGSLWGLDDVAGGIDGADTVDDASYLRSSIGVSLRIQTGLGAIQMYVAHPIASQDYDNTQTSGLELNYSF
jgi:outer membrane protein assembly factor BamA